MASRYWVGGTAIWDATVGTKWALTSGGAGGQAVPIASDDVFLDAASGTVTVTVSSTRLAKSVDCTGFTGTLTGTSTPILNVSGSVTLSSGMTFDSSAGPTLAFLATGSFTPNGQTIRNMTVNTAAIVVTLQGNLTMTASLNAQSGTFDANDFNLTLAGCNFSSATARTISMGNGTWTIKAGATAVLWTTATATNLTLNMEGATVIFDMSAAVAGTAYSIANSTAKIGTSTNPIVITANLTSATISSAVGGFNWENATIAGPNVFSISSSCTFTGPVTFNGTMTAPITLASSDAIAIRTITVTGTVSGTCVAVRCITKSGGTMTFNNSLDLGSNTGIVINPPKPANTASFQLGV